MVHRAVALHLATESEGTPLHQLQEFEAEDEKRAPEEDMSQLSDGHNTGKTRYSAGTNCTKPVPHSGRYRCS